MRRWLVRLLVLVLAPVVVAATPQLAQAATTYGTPGSATVHLSDWRPGSGSDCGITAYYAVTGTAQSVKYKLKCVGDWNSSIEGSDFMVRFVGNSTGGACTLADTGVIGGQGLGSGSATWLSTGAMCKVGTVCLSAQNTSGWDVSYAEQCVGIELGEVPGAAASECGPYEFIGGSYAMSPSARGGFTGVTWKLRMKRLAVPSVRLAWYVVQRTSNGTLQIQWIENALTMQPADEVGTVLTVSYRWDEAYFTGSESTVLGMGVYAYGLNGTISDSQGAGPAPLTLPQDNPSGTAGLTRPSRCMWYQGSKVAATAGDSYDEPTGPISGTLPEPPGTTEPVVTDPEPVAPESSCDFSFSDPSSWASGGICALVRLIGNLLDATVSLLGSILGAIGGLVDDLLGGLADMFQALFVPDQALMQQKIEQVKDAWSETPPGVVVGELASVPGMLTAPSSLGCAGPSMTLDLPMSDEAYTWNPLSTCEPGRAQLASIVRIALQLAVAVGGFLAGVRILGAAFGVDASLGRGAD